jgi:DNA polymerase I
LHLGGGSALRGIIGRTMARLFLIDVFGFLFRAYHARARSAAPPMRTSKGLSTEAVYIFHNMLRKLLNTHSPEYVAAVFESAGPTFREQSFAEYKANRTEMPADLGEQIPYVRRVLEALRIPMLQLASFEADDVIGAISRTAPERGVDVVIVSSDKDMMQLVNERVSMMNPMKDDAWYDPAKVTEFMGVPPVRVTDLLALVGDSVDNIPGAPGIGDKGAKDLILRFGSVEAAIERAAEVERKTYRESLATHRDQILLSKRLATIDVTAPIEWELDALCCQEPDTAALKQIYRELEFFSLLKEMGPSEAPPNADYQTLESADAVDAYLGSIAPDAPVAIALAQAGEGELSFGSVLGLSNQTGVGRAASFQFMDRLRPLLEDPARPKVTHDLKSLLVDLEREGIAPAGFTDDVMLEAFLINSDPGSCSLESLSERHLDLRLSGAADQKAAIAFELHEKLREEVTAKGLEKLYQEIDLPLAHVLARMQKCGIRIEPSQMQRLGERLDAEIQRLTAEIHELAGRPFNINSPQQLGKILFEDLGLPAPVKYGKGKTISTAADVLEALSETHQIVAKVLDYRQLVKLKGTYVDALPNWVDPATGRLHTSLNQAGAATGRLSSSNPNLQNIPIRTELGREIRAAFVPRPGWKLLVADYSQIELRLLAHLSGDPVLVEAFRNGEDIHTRTAAEVFGAIPGMVTAEMRRRAKAVNFGIVYGQTSFGLASGLGISRGEADAYIKRYFARYAGVKKFIEETIEEVKQTGVSRTIFGRLRPIPDIRSRNPNARGFAERTAINTPMQGAAADLIKLAMIRIDAELERPGWQTKMLLQVHDELLFESPPEEVERASALVKEQMEGVYELTVPLVVEVGVGENWRDAK